MHKDIVENNGELGRKHLKECQKLHDTAKYQAIQNLTERNKKRNNQEKPSWDDSKLW